MVVCEKCNVDIHIKHGHRSGHCFCQTCYSKWRDQQPGRKTYKKQHYQETKEQFKVRGQQRYHNKRKEVLTYHRNRNAELRKTALSIIGTKCLCCGVTEWWNLTIDHIVPLFGKARFSWQNGQYYDIINNPDEAKSKYQVFCFGCNTSKNRFSKCEVDHGEIS